LGLGRWRCCKGRLLWLPLLVERIRPCPCFNHANPAVRAYLLAVGAALALPPGWMGWRLDVPD